MTAAGSIGRLDIGVISSSLVGIIPGALDIFTSRFPDVDWQLHELTPALQIQGLLERRIDVCLFRMPPHQEGLHREIIMQEALMIAMPRSHPLASQTSVSLMELKDQPLVMFGLNQSRFADFLYQCCVKAGFTPRIRQQVVEVQSLLSLVGANIGLALYPPACGSWRSRKWCLGQFTHRRRKFPYMQLIAPGTHHRHSNAFWRLSVN